MNQTVSCEESSAYQKMSFLDRYLTLWIFLAMAVGVGIGVLFPQVAQWNEALSVGSTNIPLAIGLILMMYPPLAKVNYSLLGEVTRDKRAITLSLVTHFWIHPCPSPRSVFDVDPPSPLINTGHLKLPPPPPPPPPPPALHCN
nr:hypothetical protein [Vibrio vulnificus]